MVNLGSCCHQIPFLHCRFEFWEKKKVTLLDMGNMEDAGHGYAVFSLDSHTHIQSRAICCTVMVLVSNALLLRLFFPHFFPERV